MRVRVYDDITLEIVDDPEHDQKFKGHYIWHPNSVRRDITFPYALAEHQMVTSRPVAGRQLE